MSAEGDDKVTSKAASGVATADEPAAEAVTGGDATGEAGARDGAGDGAGDAKVSLLQRIARRAGRVPAGARIATVTVLAVLVAGSGVAAGLWATQASDSQATQAERDAAVAAAKTEIPQILSYNYKTLNADLARANADTTGQFSGQFGVLASQMIGPEATKQQTVTKAVVPVAAALSSSGGQVTVLAFVDQSTTSKTQPKAQTSASQIRVTMEKVKGRWLVAVFDAL